MSVQSELNAFGATQVLVYLKAPVAREAAASKAENPVAEVTKHFAHSSDSRFGELAASKGSGPVYRVFRNLGVVMGAVDERSYKEVKASAAVRAVTPVPELSLIRPVATAVAAPKAGPTWGIKRLRIPELWKAGITGAGVIVAHLDTGVAADHPVLKDAIAGYAEFDEMGRRVSGAKPRDSGEHGTHTAATIAGRPSGKAVVGVAPGAKLAAAMVIEGGNVVARILGGMDWAIGQGAKILSMSLGLRGYREEFLPLMRTVRVRGLLPVIAVGNEGPGTSRSPGNYDLCLSVGACDERDEVPEFSSSQHFTREDDPYVPDVVAPGVGVLSAIPGGKFGLMDGTSMATPHIAGLAALLWEAKPNATIGAIEKAILESCVRPASMPRRCANRGVPDAVAAYEALKGEKLAQPPKIKSTKARSKAKKASPKR